MFELACAETAGGRREFEGPQEVGRLLKVGTNSEDLVDQVFNRNDSILAELLLNEGVVGLGRQAVGQIEHKCNFKNTFATYQGDPLLIDLSVATLVDQLADGLEVGFTVSNPRLDDAKHLCSCLGKLDEHTIVDLEEAEKLKDFAGLRGDLVYAVVHRQCQSQLCKKRGKKKPRKHTP